MVDMNGGCERWKPPPYVPRVYSGQLNLHTYIRHLARRRRDAQVREILPNFNVFGILAQHRVGRGLNGAATQYEGTETRNVWQHLRHQLRDGWERARRRVPLIQVLDHQPAAFIQDVLCGACAWCLFSAGRSLAARSRHVPVQAGGRDYL